MLQSKAISHSHYLERYKTHVVKRILSILKESDKSIVQKIRAVEDDPFNQRRLERMLSDIRIINSEAEAQLNIGLTDELKEFGAYEADFEARTLQKSIPIQVGITQPSPDQIYAAVKAKPFDGLLLKDQVRRYGQSRMLKVEQAIRQGWVEGESITEIVGRVRGTPQMNFTNGVLNVSNQHAEALVRTAVNHTHAVARESLFNNNRDIIKGVQYVATLDTKTTMICANLDGKVFPVDEGPRPPQHFNCRSTVVPVVKSWREMGIDRDEVPATTRASMDGQEPAKTTYSSWLKRQSAGVQRDALGDRRYEMFRDGTPIEKFVRDGRELTLEQLKKAGVE